MFVQMSELWSQGVRCDIRDCVRFLQLLVEVPSRGIISCSIKKLVLSLAEYADDIDIVLYV